MAAQKMSIYQLPQEIIAIIINYVPHELHFILKCIKIFSTYIKNPKIYTLVQYSARNGYSNILQEFLQFISPVQLQPLCMDAIKCDQLNCLGLIFNHGAMCTTHMQTLAAQYSAQIFRYIYRNCSVRTDINLCRMRAIQSHNIDVLDFMKNLRPPVTKTQFNLAIKMGNLSVIKVLTHKFREKDDPCYITMAILLARKDIVDFLIANNFKLLVSDIKKFLVLDNDNSHVIKDILIDLSYCIPECYCELVALAQLIDEIH